MCITVRNVFPVIKIMTKDQKYCTHCGVALVDRHGNPMHELYDIELHKKSIGYWQQVIIVMHGIFILFFK